MNDDKITFFGKQFHLLDLVYVIYYYTPEIPILTKCYIIEYEDRITFMKVGSTRHFLDPSLIDTGNIVNIFRDEYEAQEFLESLPAYIKRQKGIRAYIEKQQKGVKI